MLARSCAQSGTPASRHPSAHNGCKLLLSVLVLAATFLIAARPVFAAGIEPLGAVPVPATNPQTAEKIDLGRTLFFDRRLSGDGTMSCASCHIPEQGFADGQAIALNYPTTRNWRKFEAARRPSETPIMGDCMWRGGGPHFTLPPPPRNGQWDGAGSEFNHFAIMRHGKGSQLVFFDGSARRVRTRDLWYLPWTKDFNTNYQYPANFFPPWMR